MVDKKNKSNDSVGDIKKSSSTPVTTSIISRENMVSMLFKSS